MPYLRYAATLCVLGIVLSTEAEIFLRLTAPKAKDVYQCFEQWPRNSSWCRHVRAT